jgi:serine protease Do
MSQPHSRQLTSLALVFGAVVFGMVLAGGVDLTPPGASAPAPAAAAAAVPAALQGLPSFADLADAVVPAVVSIDAVTIERGQRGGPQGPQGMDPFEFFFGPRRRQAPPGEPGDEPEEFRQDSGGSGFVISGDGLIITNNHVIDGATSLRVHLGNRFYPAEVKGTDPATDLALLKISADRPLSFLDLGDSDGLRVGDWVVAIGNPLLLEQTVTVGVVSAKGRQIGINDRSFENFIQTDAAINRGNSGGPLVDLQGRVVGIATAMNWGAENIGFAVPINTLKEILPQLRDKGRVSRGYLGVDIGNLDFETMEAFGLQSSDGALVQGVRPDTPAADAGLRHGDVIVEVDGRPVKETRDLISYVSQKSPGSTVVLDVVRDGKRIESRVKLSERPEGDAAAAETRREPRRESGIDWLGLQYQDLTPNLRNLHGVPEDVKGVLITDVSASSPLVEEGVREGDVITEVSGQPVTGLQSFEAAVKAARPGAYVRFYVRRYDRRAAGSFFAIVRAPQS